MTLYSIFGDPVSHSFSPKIHNACFKEFGLRHLGYTRTRLEDGSKLRETFLDLNLKGANVTVPHKEEAFKACDEVRGVAKVIGAVNTVVNENGRLIGYNTDAPGFVESLKAHGNFQKILIIGGGGTAKALATAFKDEHRDLTVVNRSKKRLDFFKESGIKAFTWESFKPEKFDVVINTTSAGLEDNSLPIPEEILEKLFETKPFAVDVIYNKNTPFLQYAKSKDLKTADGEGMLIWQGVLAFSYFTSIEDKQEIYKTMKEAFAL
ncbi:MAG: shikimate dehydrogenase [Campylobacterales bacterium]|nr:shikimate dehydrogenase [Campylobacterales bacterium]